ncbi:phosphomannose isomerase type II C-terminal cupin domain [Nostocoides japonicum]|nr:phosphomannose isomerase type II C-terminal cupin domain [Tetrasphaera japonica]
MSDNPATASLTAGRADPTDDLFVVERPWGRFEQFVTNEPCTVKIITVQPGHRLSLQTHDRRGEFWRILDGTLRVTVGHDTRTVRSGDSVWIPVRTLHRMESLGDTPVRVLEIAFGDFDEADIVRHDDDYAR